MTGNVAEWMQVAGDVGSLLGGLATVAAALYAYRQYTQWQKQKDAEVANAALVAVKRACLELRGWAVDLETTDLGRYAGDPIARADRVLSDFQAGRDEAFRVVRALEDCALEASIHLPADANPEGLAAEAARVYLGLLSDVDEWQATRSPDVAVQLEGLNAISEKYTSRVRLLREQAIAALGPIARGEAG